MKQNYATFPEYVLVACTRTYNGENNADSILWTMDTDSSSIQEMAKIEIRKLEDGYVHVWKKTSDTDGKGRLIYTEAFTYDTDGLEWIGERDGFIGFLWQCSGDFSGNEFNNLNPMELGSGDEYRDSIELEPILNEMFTCVDRDECLYEVTEKQGYEFFALIQPKSGYTQSEYKILAKKWISEGFWDFGRLVFKII